MDPYITGGVGAAIAAVPTALLAWLRLRRTATKDEMAQAFEAQDKVIDRVEKDNERLRGRNDGLHQQLNDLLTRVYAAEQHHRECEEARRHDERRIQALERRLAELEAQ